MTRKFLELAFTPHVRAAQAARGHAWNVPTDEPSESDRLGTNEIAFLASRDSFYLATVSETGWPYVQHRGGPPGFLTVIDDRTLAFGDYRGNRQYVSVGNLRTDDRASLIAVDYPQRARLKLLLHVEVLALEDDPALSARVTVEGYKAKLERLFRLRVEAYDWNCPQHITPRFTEREIAEAVLPLRERLEALEAENAALRARLAGADESS